METILVVKNEKTGEEYFSSQDTEAIIEKVLGGDSANNTLKVVYQFELDSMDFIITQIAVPEILRKEINGFEAVIQIYVKKV